MQLTERKKILLDLGLRLDPTHSDWPILMERAREKNGWFTPTNVTMALNTWSKALVESEIDRWLKDAPTEVKSVKTVGIVMAGNLPMVGLHDLISVLAAGHNAHIKLSSDDDVLMKHAIMTVQQRSMETDQSFEIVDKLHGIDAVIATGSNNTARYFEYYFRNIPKIIRKNRTGIAVLSGDESKEELTDLADDIFSYFGLGCRNVSQIFVPKNMDLVRMIDCFEKYEGHQHHHKYANNYTYHKAIFLMNLNVHLDNGFLLIKESNDLHAPLSCLFYHKYDDLSEVVDFIARRKDEIQVVASNVPAMGDVALGRTQQPQLTDYADGVNTLRFMQNL
jgi:hypothetical protein